MKKIYKVVLIVGNGFDETEVKVPIEYLPANGVTLDIATVYRTADVLIEGKKGYKIKPTVKVSDLKSESYDAVLLPGGHEGPDRVRGNETVIKFVQDMYAAGKIIAAICHGPWVLCTAEVFYGRKATCYPAMKADLIHAGGIYVAQNVVIDNNLITADRPETSEAWSQAIVTALKNE